MVTTHGDLSYVSPLAQEPVGPKTARLADWSGRQVLDGRGRSLPAALDGGSAPEAVGDVTRVDNGFWVRLRMDRWFFVAHAAGGGVEPVERNVIDVTHAYGILHLSGSRTADVLAQVSGLDFGDRAFPDDHAAQTSLAKVAALIVRRDEPQRGYVILVERSLAAYVWDVLADVLSSVAP